LGADCLRTNRHFRRAVARGSKVGGSSDETEEENARLAKNSNCESENGQKITLSKTQVKEMRLLRG
jgi:hypothetical protein